MIILSEASSRLESTPSSRELHASTETARLTDCTVYHIPQDFSGIDSAADALAHIPEQNAESLGIWIGYIPPPEHYKAVFDAAIEKGIRLLNTPEQHLRAQEFDRAYPRLEGLTPRSVIVTDPSQCEAAVSVLGLPVFVKGIVQSRKARGWKACVAESPAELRALTSGYLSLEGRTRGRVAVRELVQLRFANKTALGFPIGREFRIFMYGTQVLGYGYYWDGDDPLSVLTPAEHNLVIALAVKAAIRMDVPFLAVDIGQLEDGRWIVIETGDAQFSSVSQIPLLPLWHEISKIGYAAE